MVHNLRYQAFLLLCLSLCISKGICMEQHSYIQRSYTEEQLLISEALFEEWKTTFNKVYLTDEEYTKRFKIWRHNDAYIENHNSQQPPPSFTLGHNQFSDLTNEEFTKLTSGNVKRMTNYFRKHGSTARAPASEVSRNLISVNIPTGMNWVLSGKVTSIKNQGNCSASWAFAAAATMESIKAIDDDDLIDLSVQELIDCNNQGYDCDSGSGSFEVFDVIDEMGGLCKWEDYPYDEKKHEGDVCYDCDTVDGTDVDEFEQVAPDRNTLLDAIADRPVWATIVANSTMFQFYEKGIFRGNCGSGDPNLAVEIVGYELALNQTDLASYWLIKNSWGTDWGEDGYMKLPQNVTEELGKCDILANAWLVSSAWYYGVSGCMMSLFFIVGSIPFLI